uniref:non-specific serine/threonine protein kinase n=1 Tax=Prymnesium polylepis TaxID=72548 RepID=A0A6V4PRF8_9EUKA|mmetsp:Transcript_28101/g.75976  ORF Transcript_28101/g.75976 Transcript_28101/m.75976 type:complete len:342 (+) Transcript_28101:78-1103(+)
MPSRKVDHFEVQGHKLGDGGFGAVYRAKDLNLGGEPCAAKLVKLKSKHDKEAMEHEVSVMKLVAGHPYVILLRGYVPEGEDAWLFMELATGGELFDRLIDSGKLSENLTRTYAKSLIDGVQFCHSKGVIHRDIKLENIMLLADNPEAVKIIDFGLAAVSTRPFEEELLDPVGTKSYKAPEIIAKGRYLGPPVDVWSIGITLFSLVSGFFPLEQAKQSDWRYARLAADQAKGIGACDSIYATYKRQCPFTPVLKAMLDSMLNIEPSKRPTLEELSKCAWLNPPAKAGGAGGGYEEDDYADEIVYRGMTMDDDEDMEPFEPPEGAMLVSRQKGDRGLEDAGFA